MAVSLIPSTAANAEASQIIGTLNSVINQINTQTIAAAAGSGALSLAVFLPANSSAVNLLSITGAASSAPVILTVGGSSADANQDISLLAAGTGRTLLGGNSSNAPLLVLNATASVADQILVTGGSSGSGIASMVAQGSDTNINLVLGGKGAGGVLLGGANSLLAPLQVTQATASVADFLKITGGSSGQGLVTLTAGGSDTNIDIALVSAGTGTLRLNNVNFFTAIGAVALSLTNIGPTGLVSSTISKFLTVKDSAGGLFFIPCFH